MQNAATKMQSELRMHSSARMYVYTCAHVCKATRQVLPEWFGRHGSALRSNSASTMSSCYDMDSHCGCCEDGRAQYYEITDYDKDEDGLRVRLTVR